MDRHDWDLIIANLDKIAATFSGMADLLRKVVNKIEADLYADLDACWAALEKSNDPRDVALMKRIRERRRGGEATQGGEA